MQQSPTSWSKPIGTWRSPASRWPEDGRRRSRLLCYVLSRSPQPNAIIFRSVELRHVRRTTIRGFPKHLLFYRIHQTELLVVRGIHGVRDLRSRSRSAAPYCFVKGGVPRSSSPWACSQTRRKGCGPRPDPSPEVSSSSLLASSAYRAGCYSSCPDTPSRTEQHPWLPVAWTWRGPQTIQSGPLHT